MIFDMVLMVLLGEGLSVIAFSVRVSKCARGRGFDGKIQMISRSESLSSPVLIAVLWL